MKKDDASDFQAYFSRINIDGSMHTTASPRMCSRSKFSLVRTSSSSTLRFGLYLHSWSVFGKSVLNGSSAFSVVGVIGAITGDRCTAELSARLEGFRGTVGDSGTRAGELGRLWKVSIVGGIGVLDGRGISIGSTGNGLGWIRGGAPLALRSANDGLLEREPVLLVPVGSGRSLRTSISSISSIEGKVCAKSCKLKTDMRGEDEVDEEGEGGPKLEVGTSA